MHQRASDQAMADLVPVAASHRAIKAIAPMISTTKTMRTARNVSGSI